LSEQVRRNFSAWKAADRPKSDRYSRVDVRSAQVTESGDGECHDQPECERDSEMTKGMCACRDHYRAGSDCDQRKRAEKLGHAPASE
jgi:hypothetical protein